LKVRLNDKVVGITKLNKTQRNIGLLCVALKSDELQLSNVYAANKFTILFSRPIILHLLNCTRIIENIQVTEGRKYFLLGLHVGQSWSMCSYIYILFVTLLLKDKRNESTDQNHS
jgi:hypothetical protein